jgi:hypothetical protein
LDLSEGTNETTKQVFSFRDLLLSHCRENANPPVNGFANDPHDDDLFEHPEEKSVRLALARHCYAGSQRFVGELYKQ